MDAQAAAKTAKDNPDIIVDSNRHTMREPGWESVGGAVKAGEIDGPTRYGGLRTSEATRNINALFLDKLRPGTSIRIASPVTAKNCSKTAQ